jgi:hypothetical protein
MPAGLAAEPVSLVREHRSERGDHADQAGFHQGLDERLNRLVRHRRFLVEQVAVAADHVTAQAAVGEGDGVVDLLNSLKFGEVVAAAQRTRRGVEGWCSWWGEPMQGVRADFPRHGHWSRDRTDTSGFSDRRAD